MFFTNDRKAYNLAAGIMLLAVLINYFFFQIHIVYLLVAFPVLIWGIAWVRRTWN